MTASGWVAPLRPPGGVLTPVKRFIIVSIGLYTAGGVVAGGGDVLVSIQERQTLSLVGYTDFGTESPLRADVFVQIFHTSLTHTHSRRPVYPVTFASCKVCVNTLCQLRPTACRTQYDIQCGAFSRYFFLLFF